jgi:hypothetical protein
MKNEMGYVLKYRYLHTQFSLRYTLCPSTKTNKRCGYGGEREIASELRADQIGASHCQLYVFFTSEIRKAIICLTRNMIGGSRRMEFTLHFKF